MTKNHLRFAAMDARHLGAIPIAVIILLSKRYTNWGLSVQGNPLWGQGYKFTKLLMGTEFQNM